MRLFLTDLGADLIIEVEDSGPGIAPEIAETLFAKGVSTRSGLGGGWACTWSTRRCAASAARSASAAANWVGRCSSSASPNTARRRHHERHEIRLLIVEDDQRISELHRRFVEKTPGFAVVGVANTLEAASEMVELLEPELILLDLFFPEGSGLDLLRALRAGERRIDVILITAAREVGTLQEALHGGAFDYLVKPVYFDRFQEALAKYRDYHGRLQGGAPLEQQESTGFCMRSQPGTRRAGPFPRGSTP